MQDIKDKKNEHSDYLALLIDLIPDPVVVIDNRGIIVAANRTSEEFSGYLKEQLIGKSFAKLDFVVDKDYISLIAENAKSRFEGSIIPAYEIKVTAKNGEVRFIEVKGNRIKNNRKLLDLVIFRDVTESSQQQKKLQKDLIESEEKFHGITNSLKEPIIVVGEGSKITYWNPAAAKMFGYFSSEALGKCVHDLVVPKSMCREAKERIDISVKMFDETGAGYFTVGNVELVGRRKDNSEFPAELSISPIKTGGKWNAVGLVKDISGRKKTEQKLKEAEQRFHVLFNQAPLGVLVIDPKTASFVEFNDQAHLQLAYSSEEFKELTLHDIEAKESMDETKEHLAEIVNEGISEFETLHRTKNGEIRYVLVTARTIELANKTLLNCIFHDITEIRKVQGQLSKYSQKLEDIVKQRTEQLNATQEKLVKSERLAAIGELAGMIGHDLRNPLTGIKNAAYFLKKKGNTITELQANEMLETIETCVDYSNKIVIDLLDYSRDLNLEVQECSIKNLVIESLAMINVPEKVEIVNHILDKTQLKVDPDKIKRVFVNLIKNGIEAMPNVGKLTIDCKETGDNLEISFADTGVGIPQEALPKIFTPLFTTKAQGMGFGLAICKRITEAHGGTITVKTGNGVGTKFIVTLPIEPKIEMEVKKFG